ncbi:MAG: hypothetical protein GSR82_05525 [Desulfurococcales archaeon]|nr:hypothetical protein [Desulfurococcales archaeon]MEB3773121.1 hypothetical protein [Desulfurococcales archaeon]MEB3799057.1 hypothetical protein [Desulfurococcales archaeon]MEB3845969.1 hypothetical protein [Desulfurococcales archaeon]
MITVYTSLMEVTKQSLSNAVQSMINALPSIIAALIIIFLGVWVGKIVGSVTTRIFSSKGLMKKFAETKTGKALEESGIGIASLVGGLVYAFIAVISIAIGLEYLNIGGAADYYIGLIANYLPRLVAGLIILTLGLVFSELFAGYIGFVISSLDTRNKAIQIFPEIVKVALIVAVTVVGLDVMELNQFNIIYWIVLGFFIMILGIYLTDSIFSSIDVNDEMKDVYSLLKIFLYSIFILVGLAAVFTNSQGVVQVLSRIAWGYAIGMAFLLVLVMAYAYKSKTRVV